MREDWLELQQKDSGILQKGKFNSVVVVGKSKVVDLS